MGFAEVIGDPVAQSKSPAIHKYWLGQLGLAGDYRRTPVSKSGLETFLESRRSDPDWLGCNVTIPHKESSAALVDSMDPDARTVGAVNCIVPERGTLIGYNTDIDGVAAALQSAEIRGRKAVVIGAGGAARAAVTYLANHGIGRLTLLARNPDRAKALEALHPGRAVHVLPFDQAEAAFGGAALIVNASPLGMAGADRMPLPILRAVESHAIGSILFDMVTTPARTEFLASGEAGGGDCVDGITMLVGQAARAFELFFGAEAPPPDPMLRDLLTTERRDSA